MRGSSGMCDTVVVGCVIREGRGEREIRDIVCLFEEVYVLLCVKYLNIHYK